MPVLLISLVWGTPSLSSYGGMLPVAWKSSFPEISPMVAIAPVSGIAATATPPVASAAATAETAAPAHAASFTQEVRAVQPSSAQALGRDMADRLQGLSDRLRGWSTPAASNPADKAGSPLQAGDAVSQLQAVYTFAIETTLASRGSTETTKIFNTLLKGQ